MSRRSLLAKMAYKGLVLTSMFMTTLVLCKADKPVRVTLDAKWMNTPLILEAGEFLAEEGLYEEFVTSLHKPEDLSGIETDQNWYNHMIKVASRLLSPARVKVLEFSLSLRLFAPKVQLHQQLAESELARSGADKFKCRVFAVYSGKIHCTVKDLKLSLSSQTIQQQSLYESDYSHCIRDCNEIVESPLIIYGELGSGDLMIFASQSFGVYTVLRNYVWESEVRDMGKVRLSGYGVELAIKSTEYKAQDDSKTESSEADLEPIEGEISGFNFTRLSEKYVELHKGLREFKNKLSESSNELKPLKVWQLQDLSYQASQKAVSSSSEPTEQLETLTDLSQNLPSRAAALTKVNVDQKFKDNIRKNQERFAQMNIPPGGNELFINGIQIELDTTDIFSIYDFIKQDLNIMDQLSQHGLLPEDTSTLLKTIGSQNVEEYALDIRDSSIVYINDLENDEMYRRWPHSLNSLLQPTFPGMMRHVARNLFNLIVFFDVTDVTVADKLSFMSTLYTHSTPIRIGLLPIVNPGNPAAALLSKCLYKLIDDKGGVEALEIIVQFYAEHPSGYTEQEIRDEFKKIVGNIDEVEEDEEYAISVEKSYMYYKRSGISDLPQILLNGVPLKQIDRDHIEETVISSILQATPTFQRAVYHQKLSDGEDPLEWLMEQDHVMPRLNSKILSSNKKCVKSKPKDEKPYIGYLTRKASSDIQEYTIYVICDLDTEDCRSTVYNSLKYLKSSTKLRLAVVHNPSTRTEISKLALTVQVALQTLPMNEAKNFITKLVKEENVQPFIDGSKTLEDLAVYGMDLEKFTSDSEKFTVEESPPLLKRFAVKPGTRVIVSAGRMIGPLSDTEEFVHDDFELLEKVIDSEMSKKVMTAVKKLNLSATEQSEIVSEVVSSLSCMTSDKSRQELNMPTSGEGIIHIPARGEGSVFELQAFIDPLTRAAQKILPLLKVLPEVVPMNVHIYLNCKEKLSELPIKSFYRYVLKPRVDFNVVGGLTSGAEAYFDRLPHKSLLTINVQAPESWLVDCVSAVHDLDNIKLEQIKNGVLAGYELEYILLEGHCYDDTNQPPRGLQFVLGRDNNPQSADVDTIVMANLGYFQLKAKPGVWNLMIRPGRSADIYQVYSHTLTDSASDSENIMIVMDSFRSKIISVRVRKRADKESEDLLNDENQDEEEAGGLWNSISSSITGSAAASDEDRDENLNIFSLASGHLYERFMRIMILSIVKQTKQPVKFWLLKNYLSPEFKEFIPVMAEKYGFKYELVQYKWPRWLNQQTEKQRVMWGYKILFLDVLFPLNVKKVAFIDADQTVRADIKELFDLDLGGAPYGYTPFCTDRTEMDGFRFWKSGYWAGHLGNRPYHISALYIIDLKKFRKIAAGDRLRGQYQALSQDPNSLSNLDQDLPNNMIHQVKIKSLPQEWLWCETWCSDASKKKAKTIDLCNNPLTKEPKLEAAKRIVPEWTGYDDEVKSLWNSWKDNSSQQKPAVKDHKHIEL